MFVRDLPFLFQFAPMENSGYANALLYPKLLMRSKETNYGKLFTNAESTIASKYFEMTWKWLKKKKNGKDNFCTHSMQASLW